MDKMKFKFNVYYSYDSSKAILMNEQLGYGAKSMVDVFTIDTISILKEEFMDSRFDCLFYPPILNSNLNDDSIKQEISSLINSISTGSIYREFTLKSRSLFSYFSHDPVADFSNHSDYYKSLGEQNNFGKIVILDKIITANSQFFNLAYQTSDGDTISFSIQCYTMQGLTESLNNYSIKFPPYLMYKKGNENKLETYIVDVLSTIRYSSKNELLLKLATFTFDIDTSNLLSIPLTPGKRISYSIKSFGKAFYT